MTRIRANDSGNMKNTRSSKELDAVKKWKFSAGLLLISAMFVMSSFVAEALPFPAPNLQTCRSTEGCCTPVLSNRTLKFKFPGTDKLPLRVRPAAHRVDDAYIAKYQRATELMRALPDTDGRSFLNQYKLHCAYCDNNLYSYYNQSTSYPMEIHRSWLFLPWHRWFLYFHERILATLIDDDTFALPFWNWDNQQSPEAAVVPRVYALEWSLAKHSINKTSSLYDPDRTSCAQRETGFMEFQNMWACPPFDRNASEVRAANEHLMYMNMVSVGITPRTFQGSAYRYGDAGGGGDGALENIPHGAVHGWVNRHDMEGFKDSASDPIFYAHHANLDRLWALWKTLPGGLRGDLPDADYRDTQFTFYDERGRVVTVSIEQALNLDPLRYTYEEVPNPWLHDMNERKGKICNRNNSASELATLIETVPAFQGPINFTRDSVTFKLRRDPKKLEQGEEILELRGDVDWFKFVKGDMLSVTAYAFHPAARMDESMGCAEYLGVRWLFTHTGISPAFPRRDVWRFGIGHQLQLMGTAHLDYLVVTLVGSAVSKHSIQFTDARIVYSKD